MIRYYLSHLALNMRHRHLAGRNTQLHLLTRPAGLDRRLCSIHIACFWSHATVRRSRQAGTASVQGKGCAAGAVSRSEAGQQKALLVLDAAWREQGRIPLDLGARHFNLASAAPALPANLRAGDRCMALTRLWR